MPESNSAKPLTTAQCASDLDRLNTLAALLSDISHVARAYLKRRALVSLPVAEHFIKQRAQNAISGVYDPRYGWAGDLYDHPDTVPEVYLNKDCPVVPRSCCFTLIKERARLNTLMEGIRSLAAEALPIIRTAGPLAQYGVGESVGPYLTEVATRVNETVDAVREDLNALEDAVRAQVPYAPWIEGGDALPPDPRIKDLLEHDLLPKLHADARRFQSLAMASESTESEPIESKQATAEQETVVPLRQPERESRLVTLHYAADNWFRGFKTRQTLSKRINDGTVAAKCYARGKWAFCLVELQEKSDAIYQDALPESDESE